MKQHILKHQEQQDKLYLDYNDLTYELFTYLN